MATLKSLSLKSQDFRSLAHDPMIDISLIWAEKPVLDFLTPANDQRSAAYDIKVGINQDTEPAQAPSFKD